MVVVLGQLLDLSLDNVSDSKKLLPLGKHSMKLRHKTL